MKKILSFCFVGLISLVFFAGMPICVQAVGFPGWENSERLSDNAFFSDVSEGIAAYGGKIYSVGALQSGSQVYGYIEALRSDNGKPSDIPAQSLRGAPAAPVPEGTTPNPVPIRQRIQKPYGVEPGGTMSNLFPENFFKISFNNIVSSIVEKMTWHGEFVAKTYAESPVALSTPFSNSATVKQGEAAEFVLNLERGGTTDTYTLSVSDSGGLSDFSGTSIPQNLFNPIYNSTFTITPGLLSRPGTYTVTVSASAGVVSVSADIFLTVVTGSHYEKNRVMVEDVQFVDVVTNSLGVFVVGLEQRGPGSGSYVYAFDHSLNFQWIQHFPDAKLTTIAVTDPFQAELFVGGKMYDEKLAVYALNAHTGGIAREWKKSGSSGRIIDIQSWGFYPEKPLLAGTNNGSWYLAYLKEDFSGPTWERSDHSGAARALAIRNWAAFYVAGEDSGYTNTWIEERDWTGDACVGNACLTCVIAPCTTPPYQFGLALNGNGSLLKNEWLTIAALKYAAGEGLYVGGSERGSASRGTFAKYHEETGQPIWFAESTKLSYVASIAHDPASSGGRSSVFYGGLDYAESPSKRLVARINNNLRQGDVVRAKDILELRSEVERVRGVFGVTIAPTWSETIVGGTTPVRGLHIDEIRNALMNVTGRCPNPTWTDYPIAADAPIRQIHLSEISDTIDNIESLCIRRAFVTNGTYSGKLGGISGADALCQGEADATGVGGTWKAWVGIQDDASTAPKNRFSKKYAYRRMDGAWIAYGWDDLTLGPRNGINVNVGGSNLGDGGKEYWVWTNVSMDTTVPGTSGGGASCTGWTFDNTSGNRCGMVGLMERARHSTWLQAEFKRSSSCNKGYSACIGKSRLYCFEDDPLNNVYSYQYTQTTNPPGTVPAGMEHLACDKDVWPQRTPMEPMYKDCPESFTPTTGGLKDGDLGYEFVKSCPYGYTLGVYNGLMRCVTALGQKASANVDIRVYRYIKH